MLKSIKRQFKKLWKWLVIAVIGGVAIANIAGLPPEQAIEAIGSKEQLRQGEESLFAEIDVNGNVLRVIVVSEEVINSGTFGNPKNWVRTYTDGRSRSKYAGKGDKYNKSLDSFERSQP